MKRGKIFRFSLVVLFLAFCLFIYFKSSPSIKFTGFVVASSDSGENEWLMFGKYLNHTSWDGIDFTVIGGLNNANYTTSNSIYSSPAVANGYVYIGSDDNCIYQLNASNISQQIANYSTGGDVDSSPAVANGYVYIGSYDDNIYQLNASNISQQIANYTTEDIIESSPIIANGYVYLGSDDNCIYQLNASNISQQIATYILGDYIYSTPAVANGYVYLGSYDNNIYQLNASNISQQIATYTTGGDVYSSPAVANDYVYIGSWDNVTYQLNASNISQQIANFTTGNIVVSSPAVANGYVYIGSNDYNLYQLNASNISQQIANFTAGAAITSHPAIANGYVYIGSDDHIFYQLNASNVSQKIASYVTSDEVKGSSAIANGYVYIGNYDGIVYQLNASNISLGNCYGCCVESWSCSNWGDCSGGIQARTCTDAHSCGTVFNKSAVSQTCEESFSAPSSSTTTSVETTIVATQTIPPATADAPTEITINNPNIGLTSIVLNLNNPIERGTLDVTEITSETASETTYSASSWGSRRYKSFEINLKGINKSAISNATLNIKVEKTWLAKNNLTFFIEGKKYNLANNSGVGRMKVYRDEYENNTWMPLNTTLLVEDETYYYFSVFTPGFSIFDVLFEAYGCVPNKLRCNENQVELCVEGTSWRGIETCDYKCQNNQCVTQFFTANRFYFFVVIGIVSATLFIVIFLGLKLRRRKSSFFE